MKASRSDCSEDAGRCLRCRSAGAYGVPGICAECARQVQEVLVSECSDENPAKAHGCRPSKLQAGRRYHADVHAGRASGIQTTMRREVPAQRFA